MQGVYTREHYSAVKRNEILPFATTWVNLEGIMLSEMGQTEKGTIRSHLYVESKTQMTKQRAHRYRGQIGGC